MTKHAYRIGLSGTETKAGLEGVDKAQVNKVIYEVRSLLASNLTRRCPTQLITIVLCKGVLAPQSLPSKCRDPKF